MCIVSMVLDYGRAYPTLPPVMPITTPMPDYPPMYPPLVPAHPANPPPPYWVGTITTTNVPQEIKKDKKPNPILSWTPEAVKAFVALIEAAKQFDTVSGQPDCEDPEKGKFLDVLKEKFPEAFV